MHSYIALCAGPADREAKALLSSCVHIDVRLYNLIDRADGYSHYNAAPEISTIFFALCELLSYCHNSDNNNNHCNKGYNESYRYNAEPEVRGTMDKTTGRADLVHLVENRLVARQWPISMSIRESAYGKRVVGVYSEERLRNWYRGIRLNDYHTLITD